MPFDQNAVARPHNQKPTKSLNFQMNLRKMIWKDNLKLPEIASYSKLARASKAPFPLPPPLPPLQAE